MDNLNFTLNTVNTSTAGMVNHNSRNISVGQNVPEQNV